MSDEEVDVSDRYERLTRSSRARWIASYMDANHDLHEIAYAMAMPRNEKRDKKLLALLNDLDDEAAKAWCREQENK